MTLPPPAALTTLPSISSLVERVNPTVASIAVESVTRGVFFDFNDEGAGSGVVIRDDGYIVTNYHVVQNADEIAVSLPSGDNYTARVVGQDLITDLAVIKVDTEDPLPAAKLVNSDSVNVGDWVVAVGNSLALKGGPTVTLGIISAKGRTIDTQHGVLYDMIQTDAAINDGNSGGPVVNMNGDVIGISTAIYRQAQGIGFAVSSTVAAPIIESLIEHGRVVRPLIGLSGTDVTPANANRLGLPVDEGIIVTRMARDGPAARAGLQVGDVVVKMDGIPTPDMAKFLTRLWTYDVDDVVELEYISNGHLRHRRSPPRRAPPRHPVGESLPPRRGKVRMGVPRVSSPPSPSVIPVKTGIQAASRGPFPSCHPERTLICVIPSGAQSRNLVCLPTNHPSPTRCRGGFPTRPPPPSPFPFDGGR